MAPLLQLNAVAFISPHNHPILIRSLTSEEHPIKYHYIAHTSLDVIEERINTGGKAADCYLGLLYTIEDVAVYGYITPTKVRIVLALALTDSVVRDLDVITIFKALYMAYYAATSNPFLRLEISTEVVSEHYPYLVVDNGKWRNFRTHVDGIIKSANNSSSIHTGA